MAENYIDRTKAIKASVAIFILTFLTYQSSFILFGENFKQYQSTVFYYFIFTSAAWVMFYARSEKKIPTTGEWYPLKRLSVSEFTSDFIKWSVITIILIGLVKFFFGLPLIGDPKGITIYALFTYSLIVAIHENLLWLVMLPPFMAITTWGTKQGRFINSIPPCAIAALSHTPNIYASVSYSALPGSNTLLPVVLSTLFVFAAFMLMFYVTHTYGFASGVAFHAFYNILI